MALLPEPFIPNSGNWINAYGVGFGQGEDVRKRNLLLEAGGAMAGGMSAPAAPQGNPLLGGSASSSPASFQAGGVVDRIIGVESGGRANATNPRSSATGAGQFISSTWLDMIRRNRPDIAAGKSDGELLALRNDPNLSREMTQAYASENGQALQAAGLPVTPGTTYLSHFAGPAGARSVLSANPATPVANILTAGAMSANPHLRGMTAGDLRNWADRKMGGVQQQTAPAAPSQQGIAAGGNALLRGGDIQGGMALHDRVQKQQAAMQEEGVARQKEMWGIVGDLALAADTPEKWSAAVAAAKRGGLAVDGMEDFAAREIVLARSGRMKMALEMDEKASKPIEVGSSLVQQQPDKSFKSVYTAPAQTTTPKPIEIGGNLVEQQPDGTYKSVYTAPPAAPKPATLLSVDRKELYEADEGAQAGNSVLGSLNQAIALNEKAYFGPMAGTRGYLGSQIGLDGAVATEDLDNVITNQALDSLKATFGGMPTEGERKILLEVQGSVGKAPEVRKAIYERAKVAATRRVKFNQDKAEALRGGEYFTPGHTPAAAPPIVPSTATPPAAPITQEQYLALPSGTQYTAPDGSRRTKP